MSNPPRTRDWDASTYHRVSGPQLEWSREVIERLDLRGDESVLDAGCGSGRVSRTLLELLPEGRLIAVDGSESMAAHAREELGDGVEVICSDLLALELGEPVDAVFSNATFHWIADHAALFRQIAGWLRPGGRLEAQCGGAGNIASFVALTQVISSRAPFAAHLGTSQEPHHFAGPEETEGLLREAGFERVRCWLEPKPTEPDDPRAFLSSVCLGPHLEALPTDLRDPFIDAIVAEFSKRPVLDYVRLNISATLTTGAA